MKSLSRRFGNVTHDTRESHSKLPVEAASTGRLLSAGETVIDINSPAFRAAVAELSNEQIQALWQQRLAEAQRVEAEVAEQRRLDAEPWGDEEVEEEDDGEIEAEDEDEPAADPHELDKATAASIDRVNAFVGAIRAFWDFYTWEGDVRLNDGVIADADLDVWWQEAGEEEWEEVWTTANAARDCMPVLTSGLRMLDAVLTRVRNREMPRAVAAEREREAAEAAKTRERASTCGVRRVRR